MSQWVKGQSGNAKGAAGRRPKDIFLRRLARTHTERAVNKLAELIDCDEKHVALLACNSILDRAYGRPKQVIDATVSRRFVDVIDASERRAKLEAALARRIGVAGPETPTIQ